MQLGAGRCVYIDRSGVRCVGLCLGGTGHETGFQNSRSVLLLAAIASFRPDSRSSGVGYVAWAGTRPCAGCSGERDLRGTWDPRWTCDSGATECDVARTEWLLEYVHQFGAGAIGAGMHESGVHADGELPYGAGSVRAAVQHARSASPHQLRITLRMPILITATVTTTDMTRATIRASSNRRRISSSRMTRTG